ncbi:hypothetical protein RB653_005857 [Dictyostelium firmibasis]|uniref:RNA polymerase II nuclear localization protein SLC7A6OS n=1 Tax=Dictyostelium firmibasis TaxID=79012 RepID=A0AAN7U1X6_9MYCE
MKSSTINANNNKQDSDSHITTQKKSSSAKKIFTPNIPKQRTTKNNDLLTEMVLNPTKFEISSRNGNNLNEYKEKDKEDEERQQKIQKEIQQLQQQNINKTIKPVILKIKRKIDDDALPSIFIERPRKKAFLDSFKDFGIQNKEDEYDDNDNHKLPNDQIQTPQENNNNDIITTPNKLTVPEKDRKLFTLITTLDVPSNGNKVILTKLQQRIEEFNQKGVVSSPKQLESKRERAIKKRKESRYKQINTNRNLFSKEERELFQDHDVIELERTILDPNNLLGSTLSKEEEELISNYRTLLDEHLGGSGCDSKPMETKYVYDYYYFNPSIDQQSQLLRLHEEHPDSIETVTLPPEDDFYDILDSGLSDDSSVDSENWYREYPSSEDDDDGYDDFDDYHGFNRSNRKSKSDDEYEHDEYEIDDDYYDENDYDNEI